MSQENVGLIRSLYEAFGRGDVPAVLAAMDPAIVEGVFARLGGEWDGFSVALEELLDAGDTVVARGRYGGAYKKTGIRIHAQFAHVWTLRDGKVVKFQQYTDTLQATKAVGS